MPPTPAQIKDKLLNALDNEKNVIDEKAVEEVIGLLESTVITKEILEQTRLGRDINLVRKNSKNPAIAKRAKNLVKAWQKLIEDPGSPRVNGQHPPPSKLSPGLSPAPSPALLQAKQLQASRLSPAVSSGRVQTPPVAARSNPKISKLKQQKPGSPVVKPAAASSHGKVSATGGNEDSNLSWPVSSPSNLSESSQDRLIGDRESQEGKGSRNCPPPLGASKRNFKFDTKPHDHSTAASSTKSVNRATDQRDVSKTNVANRKRTRSHTKEESNFPSVSDTPPPPPSKQSRLVSPSQSLSTSHKNVINGAQCKRTASPKSTVWAGNNCASSDSSAPPLSDPTTNRLNALRQDSTDSRGSSKAGKVKTTEQIMEEMQRKSVDSTVIAQIRTSLSQKEAADAAQKAALAASQQKGGKKRGRKKKGAVTAAVPLELPDASRPGSDTRQLAQAKSEYIERFLQTSVAPPPGDDVFGEHVRGGGGQESLEDSSHHPQIPLGGCSSSFVQPSYDSSFHQAYASRQQDKPDSGPSASPPDVRDVLEGKEMSLEHLSEQQLLTRLPPLHPDSIDWTLHDYPAPEPPTVDESLVSRLHHSEMNSVNGTYDRFGVFRRWHEMLTTDSIYDEPLHILPYVVPND